MPTVPKSITVVAGVKSQGPRAAPACELYLSRWFRMSRAFAEARGAWYVLTVHHGLLDPQEVIVPYSEGRGTIRQDWVDKALDQLLAATKEGDSLLLLIRERQSKRLVEPLRAAGRLIDSPLEGLTLDEQAVWLEERLHQAGIEPPGSRQRLDEEKQARRERRAARRAKGQAETETSEPPNSDVELL